jgi:hypothetical protein
MNLNNFRKIIIIGCLFSLFCLAIYISHFNTECVLVSDFLNNNSIDLDSKTNSINCIIGKARIQKIATNYIILDICKGSFCLPAIIFNYSSKQKELLEKNVFFNFTGKLELYNNYYELIIYKFESNNYDYT